jgi:hypothetical protein
VVLAEPDVDGIAGKVGSIAAEQSGLGVESAAGENPAGVGPPGTVVRGVRIAFLVGVLVMDAVGGDPEDGSALKREATAGCDEVLDPLGNTVSAVREQAVVGDADADVDGEEVHDEEYGQVGPREEKESRDGAHVEKAHGDGGDPVDAAFLVLATHAKVLLDLLADLGDHGEDARGGLRSFFCLGSEGAGAHIFCSSPVRSTSPLNKTLSGDGREVV